MHKIAMPMRPICTRYIYLNAVTLIDRVQYQWMKWERPKGTHVV